MGDSPSRFTQSGFPGVPNYPGLITVVAVQAPAQRSSPGQALPLPSHLIRWFEPGGEAGQDLNDAEKRRRV